MTAFLFSDPNFKGKNFHKDMKPITKTIALERMQILIENAISNSRTYPKLAQRQAYLARRLSTKYRISMPYHMRMSFCKKCKNFIVPGVSSRIRIGRSSKKSIRVTCSFCGHIYRKIIAQ